MKLLLKWVIEVERICELRDFKHDVYQSFHIRSSYDWAHNVQKALMAVVMQVLYKIQSPIHIENFKTKHGYKDYFISSTRHALRMSATAPCTHQSVQTMITLNPLVKM